MRRLAPSFVALGIALVLVGTPAAAGDADRTLGSRQAIVSAPVATEPAIVLPPSLTCRGLISRADGSSCGVIDAGERSMLFTIEPGEPIDDVLVSRPWIVRVARRDPTVPDGWSVALTTTVQGTAPGPLFANVTGTSEDVTGDGFDDLVLGYRSEGTGHFLDVDVITTAADGTPEVLGHDRLDHGVVLVRPDRLVVFTPEYRRGDGNCCPTWVRRSVVRFVDGRLEVDEGPRRPVDDVDLPRGDVG